MAKNHPHGMGFGNDVLDERLKITASFESPRMNWREWPEGHISDKPERELRKPVTWLRCYRLWQGLKALTDFMCDPEVAELVRKRFPEGEKRAEIRTAIRWVRSMWTWREAMHGHRTWEKNNESDPRLGKAVPKSEEESRAGA